MLVGGRMHSLCLAASEGRAFNSMLSSVASVSFGRTAQPDDHSRGLQFCAKMV